MSNTTAISPRLRRSVLNAVFSVIAWVIPMAVNFGTTPILLRLLGPDGFGLQNLVGLVIGYLAVMDLGLDIAVVKFLSEYHARGEVEQENRLLSTNLQLYCVIGLLGLLVIWLSANLLATRFFVIPDDLKPQAVLVFQLAGVGFLVNMLTAWGSSTLQSLQRYDLVGTLSMINNVFGTLAGLAVVYLGNGIVGYVGTRIAVSFIVALLFVVLVRRSLPLLRLSWKLDREMLRRIGGVVAYGFVLRITGILTTGIDRTLIGAWIGTAAVTLYVVPSLVSTSMRQIVPRALSFLFPMTSELSSTGKHVYLQQILTQVIGSVAKISVSMFVPVFVLADIILTLWVGQDIANQSTQVFRILLVSGFFASFSIFAAAVIPGLGRFRVFTVYTVVKAMVMVVCGIVLIPLWGIIGAGMAVLVGGIVETAYTFFALSHYLHLNWISLIWYSYAPTLALGAVQAVLVYVLRPFCISWPGMVAVCMSSSLFFYGVAYRLGLFQEAERRVLMSIWRRTKLSLIQLGGI